MELEDIQIIAQLADSMELALKKIEEAYLENNSEKFSLAKKTLIEFQKRISENLK